jgi:cbb3-type cytochrome c oxidase subunit I
MTIPTAAAAPPRLLDTMPEITVRETHLVDVKLATRWFVASFFWVILGPVFGLIASLKLDDPLFLDKIEWLQFGRLRIAHVNGVVFGFFSNAVFGFMAYATPKLTARALMFPRAHGAAFVLWQLGVLAGETCLLAGYIQPIEAGEYPIPVDITLSIAFWTITAVHLATIARREEKRMYVTLWYWVAALVWTSMNLPMGNLILPNTVTGANSAAMHGFYLHNVVGLWITPAGVGIAYYLIPATARNTLYSHKVSLLGFWLLAFFYPMNGVHHYLYSTIPDYAQTIAIASSMMLILPVWAFTVNMWGTMAGQWKKFAGPGSFALKFSILGAVWYLITCFQGPTQALRGMQRLTHFGDYNVGHAHSAVFAVFAIWGMAAAYFVIPRYSGGKLWSARLGSWHFWLEVLGFALMFSALTIGGFQQGQELLTAQSMWERTLPRGMWMARTLGGTLMDLGLAFFVLNMVRTLVMGIRERRAARTTTTTTVVVTPAAQA